jgi:hypothetical protein
MLNSSYRSGFPGRLSPLSRPRHRCLLRVSGAVQYSVVIACTVGALAGGGHCPSPVTSVRAVRRRAGGDHGRNSRSAGYIFLFRIYAESAEDSLEARCSCASAAPLKVVCVVRPIHLIPQFQIFAQHWIQVLSRCIKSALLTFAPESCSITAGSFPARRL